MSADTDCSCQKVVLYGAAGSVLAVWSVAPGCRHCRPSDDPRSRDGFPRADIAYIEFVHRASPTSTSTAWHAVRFAPAAPVGWTVEADRRSRAKAAGYAADLARVAAGERLEVVGGEDASRAGRDPRERGTRLSRPRGRRRRLPSRRGRSSGLLTLGLRGCFALGCGRRGSRPLRCSIQLGNDARSWRVGRSARR